MDHKTIFGLITQHFKEVMGDWDGGTIELENSFEELGANSMDRAEIITLTLESLNLDIPRIELFGAQNIGQLIEMIDAKLP